MNCINHPETPVSAYCQNCGKALCTQCVRPVQGLIFCEPCLAAKLSGAPGYNVNVGAPGSSYQYGAGGPHSGISDGGPNPVLAGFLGLIPGVGAMYNGQFIKALVHVLVFVVLVSLSHVNDLLGMFIAAWVLYQVFDGYQTAKARRDGLPLPDPFGLNDLGSRISSSSSAIPPWSPSAVPGAVPGGNPPPGASAFTGQEVGGGVPPGSYASQPGAPPYVPYAPVSPEPGPMTPPPMGPPFVPRRSEPVRAIILIGLGLLFLFGTTGYLSGEWVSRGWPLILIGVGAWLVIKRVNEAKK